ncbi:restriction endonuclease subunit S [Synechococcus sp. CBW1002]|uniref:restriction endonuclease subunit S n=1 Tax=Synechococcus sp. CBW1002 TaxID=1353134 RepID=UPI0018CC960D|nr:restriction endonuclease subunit S [Synechococcus sp. CBW1002]QPN60258.1 restriction endonuclease subunit S [Synechococcus sp. CBW1002]
MSFPRYPKYKESGVEWLGEVPEDWGTSRVRWLCNRYAGGTPDKTRVEYWENGTIPWLNSGAVNDHRITEPSALITEEAFANSSAKWIPPGAILIALAGQGKTKGMVAQLAFMATCNQSMAALVPGSRIDSRFLYWWLDSNYQNIRNMAGGDLRDGLNLELIGNIQCPLPAPTEQATISAFLDHETAKIDALIAEQQRLIELLQEKRQAVISHAVTKGLNPDAPMKDSGVEWLGEVPEHWQVKKLKHVSPQVTVGIVVEPSKYYVDDGVPALRSLNVKQGEIILENLVYISVDANELHMKSKLYSGDLVAVRTGQPGTTAVIGPSLDGCNCIDLIIIRRPVLASSEFLSWYLASDSAKVQFSSGSGGAIQQHFNVATAANLVIPVPPKEEQVDIIRVIDLRAAQLDLLGGQALQAVDLLQERRSALISAAVTGQIDVRGMVPMEAAA